MRAQHFELLSKMRDARNFVVRSHKDTGGDSEFTISFIASGAGGARLLSSRVTLAMMEHEGGYSVLGAGVEAQGGTPETAVIAWKYKMREALSE